MSLRLSAKDRLIGLIPWVVGALFGAAALHLLAELRLVSPGARGFVVFRVLASREGDYDAAAAARNGLSCALEKPEP